MLIRTVHGANTWYTDAGGVRQHSHIKAIPNRAFNAYYSPLAYNYNDSGYAYEFGAARFIGGFGTYYTASGGSIPHNYGGGFKTGYESYYVSDSIGGYNGQPSTWTIIQRAHDTANWKRHAAIIELFHIYYDAQGYSRYFVGGYTTPTVYTIETAGSTTLGLQVANTTQLTGNFYRYDLQLTGLGNYRIAYFTIRTPDYIVGHSLDVGSGYQDVFRVLY